MAYFIYHGDKEDTIRELEIESNIPNKYRVLVPSSGTALNVMEGDNLVAQVNGTHIVLHGEPIEIQRDGISRWGWVIDNNSRTVLYPNNESYRIDNEVVARVTSGGGLFSWLLIMLKTRSFIPFSPFIKLEYDDDKIETLLALSIHLVDVSNSFHSP
jgi:hypothetical protein